ncbi:MAG: glycosyltransferase family 4 protein [Methanobacteriaceae archaeon]|nr:glycosyltransferase family 4 protein [Methanobacteriaceae archaeon]
MDKIKICLVSFLFHNAFIPPLSNLEKILCKISYLYSVEGSFKNLDVNSDDAVKYRIIHEKKGNLFSRLIWLTVLQIRMCLRLIKLSRKIDVVIVFTGEWEFLFVLTSKLLRKRVIWLLPSYLPHMLKYNGNYPISTRLHFKFIILFQNISFYLSDYIVLHSPQLIKEWNLEKYERKMIYAHEYYIDPGKFEIKNEFEDRKNVIGYVGRLSEEKGIMNFIKSIPLISNYNELQFLIIGDGDLRDEIHDYINRNNLENVELKYWIDNDQLVKYLNKLKLLVIPSYTESGPLIALEAMACGTPVLISNVGYVYSLIKSGENGFILENNSPGCIADKINEILKNDSLDKVAYKAYKLVQQEFNFAKTVENWKENIGDLNNK